MKIAICDDEQFSRNEIRKYIEQCSLNNYTTEIYEFSSGEEMIRTLKDKHIDIIFLDIEMEKTDGIDVAKLIRINDKKAIIILVSSHKERVFECFECEIFNFIVKPFTQERFNDVFLKALEKYNFLNKTITIKWKSDYWELPIEKIKFFESYRKHVIFHTYEGEFQIVSPLSDILDELSRFGFIQTHQGYCVNMNLIRRFDGLDIILIDGTKVPMSIRKKAAVMSEYAQYVARFKT